MAPTELPEATDTEPDVPTVVTAPDFKLTEPELPVAALPVDAVSDPLSPIFADWPVETRTDPEEPFKVVPEETVIPPESPNDVTAPEYTLTAPDIPDLAVPELKMSVPEVPTLEEIPDAPITAPEVCLASPELNTIEPLDNEDAPEAKVMAPLPQIPHWLSGWSQRQSWKSRPCLKQCKQSRQL